MERTVECSSMTDGHTPQSSFPELVVKQVTLCAGSPPSLRLQIASKAALKSKYWLITNFADAAKTLFTKRLNQETKTHAASQLMVSQLLKKNIPQLNPISLYEKHDDSLSQWILSFGKNPVSHIWIKRTASQGNVHSKVYGDVDISCIRVVDEPHTLESYLRLSDKGVFTKVKVLSDDERPIIRSLDQVNSNGFKKLHVPTSHDAWFELDEKHPDKSQMPSTTTDSKDLASLKATLKRRLRTLGKTKKSIELRLQACNDLESLDVLAKSLLFNEWRTQIEWYLKSQVIDGATRDFVRTLLDDENFGPAKDTLFKYNQTLRKRLLVEAPRLQQILQHEVGIRSILASQDELIRFSKNESSVQEVKENLGFTRTPNRGAAAQTSQNLPHKNQYLERRKGRQTSALDPKRQLGKIFYTSASDFFVVGRTASENDQLTKSAKGNQWWFHVFGYSGSHVVLQASSRTLKSKQLDPKLARIGSILAIHFSSRRQSMAADVTMARRSDLKKPPKSAPGQWSVLKATTLKVQYSSDELESIYKTNLSLGEPA